MQNYKPASEKQINYLKDLGYEGDTEGLTAEECNNLIRDLALKKGLKKTDEKPAQNEPVKNEVATTNNTVAQKPKAFSSFMNAVGNKIVANTITDEKRKAQFIANVVSAVSNNPTLQECDQVSVLSGALQADALHFPINNTLGYCYLVPFNDKKTGIKKAQFQIGYKGYIQLAIRSGQYRNIEVAEVKEGELNEWDPLKGMTFNWNRNYNERKKLKTIGYVGELELINGFNKKLYISYDEMLDHANTYSQAFNLSDYQRLLEGKIPQKDMWKYSSFWYKSFDEMAKKTVIRQLLSKWGIMSVEMQTAYDNDMAAFDIKGNKEYIDSKEYAYSNVEEVFNVQEENTGTKDVFKDVVEDDNV